MTSTKKIQKFTGKPQLAYFVCSFAYRVTYFEIQFNHSKLRNFITSEANFTGFFSLNLTRKCIENQGFNALSIRGYDITFILNSKLYNFITSRTLIKTSQNFLQDSFSIKLTKIYHKNRVEISTSGSL